MATFETLSDLFIQLEKDFDIPTGLLNTYALEDDLKGKDKGNPHGTQYTMDGLFLYALVRYLHPKNILEVGTHYGGSAAHMAVACIRNKQGAILTVDIMPAQAFIPSEYKDIITTIRYNIDSYLPKLIEEKQRFDFIFEDGLHSEGQVHNIYKCVPQILNEGRYIVSHDTAMDGVGDYIRNGMCKGGADMDAVRYYHLAGTPGFSVYRYEDG